jgi:hypothetical protein
MNRPHLLLPVLVLLPALAFAAQVRAPERAPEAIDPAAVPSSAGIIPPGAQHVTAAGRDMVSLTLTGIVGRESFLDLAADLRSVHFLAASGDSLYALRVPRENLEALLQLDGVDRVQFSTTVATASRAR